MATAKQAAKSTSNGASAASSSSSTQGAFVCAECGRSFERAAALGAHRNRAHGIKGSSASAKTAQQSRRRRGAGTGRGRTASATATPSASRTSSNDGAGTTGVNRDTLLKALFPNGVPPRESVLREVSEWLDRGERLAKLR